MCLRCGATIDAPAADVVAGTPGCPAARRPDRPRPARPRRRAGVGRAAGARESGGRPPRRAGRRTTRARPRDRADRRGVTGTRRPRALPRAAWPPATPRRTPGGPTPRRSAPTSTWLEARGIDWRRPGRRELRAYLAELTDGSRPDVGRPAAGRDPLLLPLFATREELCAGDPWGAIATPRQPRRLPQVLEVDEVEALLDAVEAHELAAAPSGRGPAAVLAAALALRDRAIVETAYAAGPPDQRAGRRHPRLARPAVAARSGSSARAARSGSGCSGGRPARRSPSTSTDGRPVLAARGVRARSPAESGRGRRVFLNHLGRAARRARPALPARRPASDRGPAARACRRTPCATASRPTSSTAGRTCGSSRSCSATRAWPRPRSTPTSRRPGCGRPTRRPIRAPGAPADRPVTAGRGARPGRPHRHHRVPRLAAPRLGPAGRHRHDLRGQRADRHVLRRLPDPGPDLPARRRRRAVVGAHPDRRRACSRRARSREPGGSPRRSST